MRDFNRIEKILNSHIIDHLHDDGLLTNDEFATLCFDYDAFKIYWNKNPDQRLFQVLINLNICKDDMRWFKEDSEILNKYIKDGETNT